MTKSSRKSTPGLTVLSHRPCCDYILWHAVLSCCASRLCHTFSLEHWGLLDPLESWDSILFTTCAPSRQHIPMEADIKRFRFSSLLLMVLCRIFWISLPPVIIATAICPHHNIHTTYIQKVVDFLHVNLQFLFSQTSEWFHQKSDYCLTTYHVPVMRQAQGPWSKILNPPSQCYYSKDHVDNSLQFICWRSKGDSGI